MSSDKPVGNAESITIIDYLSMKSLYTKRIVIHE